MIYQNFVPKGIPKEAAFLPSSILLLTQFIRDASSRFRDNRLPHQAKLAMARSRALPPYSYQGVS